MPYGIIEQVAMDGIYACLKLNPLLFNGNCSPIACGIQLTLGNTKLRTRFDYLTCVDSKRNGWVKTVGDVSMLKRMTDVEVLHSMNAWVGAA